MSDAIRDHVRKIVVAHATDRASDEQERKQVEARGHRLVSGGPYGDTWSITDWRTSEVIAQGDGGHEEYEAALEQLDPDNRWYHDDHIGLYAPGAEITPTDGVPDSLMVVLEDWVSGSDDEDVALIAGWSLDELEAARAAVL